jgi:hypothetical protein
LHILPRRQRRQKVERLKHKSDSPCADSGPFRCGSQFSSLEQHTSRAGSVETAEQMKQGGFAAAARPHDCHVLVTIHAKGNVPQSHAPARGVFAAHSLSRYDRLGHQLSLYRFGSAISSLNYGADHQYAASLRNVNCW